MNCEEAIQLKTSENRKQAPEDICILLVDSNPSCLTIISKMLHKSGYRVITANRASEALCNIRNKEDELDLILAETHLPDMDKYELLETIGEISDLPVVVMSADENENAILGCLFKGATFYLMKPIIMDDLKNIWQFTAFGKRDILSQLDGELHEENGSDDDAQGRLLLDGHIQDRKRKEREEVERNEDNFDESGFLKKPKLIWTDKLQDRFLQAIRDLGTDGACPDKILQHMNTPGLTEEDILIHLQKCRLALTQEQVVVEKTMFVSHHQQAASNFQDGFLQHPENLGNCTTMSFLGSANLRNQVESSKTAHSNLPGNNQLDPTGESSKLQRIVNSDEEEFIQGEIDISDIAEIGLENIMHWPILLDDSIQEQKQQQCLPPYKQEEDEIPGAEKGEVDDLFGMPNISTKQLMYEISDDLW